MNLASLTNQLNNLQIKKTKYTYRTFTSGTIPAMKIAKCIADTASIDPSMSNHFLLDVKLLDVPTEKKYWIMLKNTVSGDEEMTQISLDKKQTKRWSELFCNSNLFTDIDLYGKYSFPKLKLPDPEMELWEQTGFKIDDVNFMATTIVDPPYKLNSSYDYVHVCIKTPWLPKTYTAYKNLTSSHSRKLVLYHEAITTILKNSNFKIKDEPYKDQEVSIPLTPAQAVKAAKKGNSNLPDAEVQSQARESLLNFSIASTLHGEAIVDNGDWHMYKLEGAFTSSEIEKSAGSTTIQTLLSHLYPYLLIMDADSNVQYDIVQPCKYAYTFALRNLGGCKIWGAVNMGACYDSLINAYEQYSIGTISSSSNTFRHSGHFGTYLDCFSLYQLKQLLTLVQANIAKLSTEFKALGFKAPFDTIEYPLENDDNHEIFTGDSFKIKLKYMGLELIQKQLKDYLEYKEKIENTKIVDYFLKQFLLAHNNEPFSYINDTKTMAITVNAFIAFVASIVDDFVSNVKASEGSVKPSAILNFMDVKVAPKTITFEQSIMFLKSCMGHSPDKWKQNISRELGITSDQLLKAIYYMPSLFKMLFNAKFFQEKKSEKLIEKQVVPLLAQNSITFEGSIYETVLKRDGYAKAQSETNIKAALVYKVFETNGVSNWQWKD